MIIVRTLSKKTGTHRRNIKNEVGYIYHLNTWLYIWLLRKKIPLLTKTPTEVNFLILPKLAFWFFPFSPEERAFVFITLALAFSLYTRMCVNIFLFLKILQPPPKPCCKMLQSQAQYTERVLNIIALSKVGSSPYFPPPSLFPFAI